MAFVGKGCLNKTPITKDHSDNKCGLQRVNQVPAPSTTSGSSSSTMVRSPKCFGGCCKTLNEGLDSWSTNLTFLGLNESMPIGMSTMFCATSFVLKYLPFESVQNKFGHYLLCFMSQKVNERE